MARLAKKKKKYKQGLEVIAYRMCGKALGLSLSILTPPHKKSKDENKELNWAPLANACKPSY
jgi:hypothetical protein